MNLIEFWTLCSANGIVLDKEQSFLMERYHNDLKYWNAKVNLISRKDEENIFERHILHSLTLLKYADIKKNARCIDVGTGGGLPGLPIKIARQDLKMLLVDSIAKKIKMTTMFAQHTELKGVSALCARTEDLASNKEYIGHFDVVVSRAVARTGMVISWVKKIIKPEAKILLLKGGSLDEEISEAKSKYPNLSIKIHNITLFGAPWFQEDEKKILECTLN